MTKKHRASAPDAEETPDAGQFRQECRRNTGGSRTVGGAEPPPEPATQEEILTDE